MKKLICDPFHREVRYITFIYINQSFRRLIYVLRTYWSSFFIYFFFFFFFFFFFHLNSEEFENFFVAHVIWYVANIFEILCTYSGLQG